MRKIAKTGVVSLAAVALAAALVPAAYAADSSSVGQVGTYTVTPDTPQQVGVAFEMEIKETVTITMPKKISGLSSSQNTASSDFSLEGNMALGSTVNITSKNDTVNINLGWLKLSANDTTNCQIARDGETNSYSVVQDGGLDVSMPAVAAFVAEMATGTQTYMIQLASE